MSRDVKRVVESCELCQKAKASMASKVALNPILLSGRNELLAIYLYGPLPRSRGGVCFVLVLLDVFTKFVIFYALKKTTTREILHRLVNDYFDYYDRMVFLSTFA